MDRVGEFGFRDNDIGRDLVLIDAPALRGAVSPISAEERHALPLTVVCPSFGIITFILGNRVGDLSFLPEDCWTGDELLL